MERGCGCDIIENVKVVGFQRKWIWAVIRVRRIQKLTFPICGRGVGLNIDAVNNGDYKIVPSFTRQKGRGVGLNIDAVNNGDYKIVPSFTRQKGQGCSGDVMGN